MSTVGSTPAHRIGILMSPDGRFVECIHCLLRFEFPQGAHYDTICKQFAPYPCSSTIPSNNDYSQ